MSVTMQKLTNEKIVYYKQTETNQKGPNVFIKSEFP